jgi:hypothetical protein
MGRFGKKVEINLNPLAYNIGLLGESGIGKSTIIKEVCEKLAGEDGYIMLDVGKEDGHKAISGIISEPVRTWSKFAEVIDDIVENKQEDYPNLKVVGIDTYDQLCELAEKEVVRMWNKKLLEQQKPQIDTINSAFGGFGKGLDKAIDIILEKLWALKSVGVSFIIIAHVKRTDVTDVMSEEQYSMLTASTTQKYFNAIKTKLDFLGMAYIDREMVKVKTKKKDNNGNVIEKNKISGESRVINFRDDTYSVDSKCRFANIVDQIPFDSDAFIKAMKDAILAEQEKDGISLEDAKAKQAKEAEEAAAVAKANSDNAKAKKIEEQEEVKRSEILNSIMSKFTSISNDEKLKIKDKLSAEGYSKLTDPSIPVKLLKEIDEGI